MEQITEYSVPYFLIREMGIMTPTSQDGREDERQHVGCEHVIGEDKPP